MKIKLKSEQKYGSKYIVENPTEETKELNNKLLSFELVILGRYKGKTFMSVSEVTKKINETIGEYDSIYELYLLQVLSMESYKKPRVMGDGYITIPTEVIVSDEHYDRVDVFYNSARETRFGGDWAEDNSYPGYTFEQYWNGWDMPYFTKETCYQILTDSFGEPKKNVWDADEFKYWYDYETDTFYEQQKGDEIYPLGSPSEVNGNHVYDLGAGNWCWDKAKAKESEDE